MALDVVKIVRVRPAPDSTRDSLDLPLTFFDLPWLTFHPVQRVFFYRLTRSTREFFYSDILPKLELSLSAVLRHYLPLAGQLTWDPREPKPHIVVSSNDTVSLTIAETDADFSRLTDNGQRPETELCVLVPKLQVSDESAPVVSLQVTLFPNQGFCIGVSIHHAAVDGKTASMFIKSWAHICKQQESMNSLSVSLPEDLTPCYDRHLIKDSVDLDKKMLELLPSFKQVKTLKLFSPQKIGTDFVRFTFELTRENIEKLRDRVKNESPSLKELHVSSFVISYAYLWTCMVKARGGDADRLVSLLFVADLRHRLDPPMPETYFGNCLYPAARHDKTAGEFMGEEGFVAAVETLSESVKGLESSGITERLFDATSEAFKAAGTGRQFGSVAGSARLGVYGSDFGWGRPEKVEVISINQGEAISMAEKRDEVGGVEMGLCLEKTEMELVVSLFMDGLKNL